MGDIVHGRYDTWEIWYMGDIVHGRYGTWKIWYMGDMVHVRYGTREIWYMGGMVYIRYCTCLPLNHRGAGERVWTVLRKPSPLKQITRGQPHEFLSFSLTEKSYGDGQGAKLAGTNVTGSHSLEPARRRRGLDCRLVSDPKTTLRLGCYPVRLSSLI